MTVNGDVNEGPDLGAIRARQQEKARVPDYDSGAPELAMQARVPLVDNAPSFMSAIDRAAFILGYDGWSIEAVSQCALLGMNEQGSGFLQVVVTARRS